MEIKENELNIIIKNNLVSRTLGKENPVAEAVEVIHIPTGMRAESFSLSTVMANKARCMENLSIMLKSVPKKPVAFTSGNSRDPLTLRCGACGQEILAAHYYCPQCGQAILKTRE
ncbi:MAG: hypothetical protein PHQ50_05525 [Eubacteriales bacterium]|nr:hypothetical protein [Eubacteriales bacterium]MDD3349456.1 hypothetical protein [Eubacteriales bacterium]